MSHALPVQSSATQTMPSCPPPASLLHPARLSWSPSVSAGLGVRSGFGGDGHRVPCGEPRGAASTRASATRGSCRSHPHPHPHHRYLPCAVCCLLVPATHGTHGSCGIDATHQQHTMARPRHTLRSWRRQTKSWRSRRRPTKRSWRSSRRSQPSQGSQRALKGRARNNRKSWWL